MDHLYNHPELYDADKALFSARDLAFWLEFAERKSVLEIGCGTGRLSVELAAAGSAVTAVDNGTRMIAHARETHPDVAGVDWIEADVLEWTAPDPVDRVLLPLNTFNHFLSVDDQLNVLANCRDSLVSGGRLALETFNPVVWRPYDAWTESRRVRAQGTEWTRMERHRRDGGPVFILELAYLSDDRGKVEVGTPLRIVHRYELAWLLQRSGFRVVRFLGDHDGRPFTGWDPRLIAIAEKA